MGKGLSYFAYNQRDAAGWTLTTSRSIVLNTHSDPS
jgi:hypothetical protein